MYQKKRIFIPRDSPTGARGLTSLDNYDMYICLSVHFMKGLFRLSPQRSLWVTYLRTILSRTGVGVSNCMYFLPKVVLSYPVGRTRALT